jgi:hypothetical protein
MSGLLAIIPLTNMLAFAHQVVKVLISLSVLEGSYALHAAMAILEPYVSKVLISKLNIQSQ